MSLTREESLARSGLWTGNPQEPCESCGTTVTVLEFGTGRNPTWSEPLFSPGAPQEKQFWLTHDEARCRERQDRRPILAWETD